MKLHIVAAGRLKAGPLLTLQENYSSKINSLYVHEVEERRKLPAPELKAREAALLLAAVPKGALVAALDGGGSALSSEALAARLAGWRQAAEDVAFLIGGAEGLGAAALKETSFRLSLGPATWPHFLARIMLLEQLYRAQQILAGHPYHRA